MVIFVALKIAKPHLTHAVIWAGPEERIRLATLIGQAVPLDRNDSQPLAVSPAPSPSLLLPILPHTLSTPAGLGRWITTPTTLFKDGFDTPRKHPAVANKTPLADHNWQKPHKIAVAIGAFPTSSVTAVSQPSASDGETSVVIDASWSR